MLREHHSFCPIREIGINAVSRPRRMFRLSSPGEKHHGATPMLKPEQYIVIGS
jgi:hypothetical protein